MSDDSAELLPRGHRAGAWEITELIGTGGWGTVYAARRATPPDGDTSTGGEEAVPDEEEAVPDEVALKFLPTAGLAPRQARGLVETARRETELSRRTRHPRLIRL
ncbi:hypothetical protein ACIPPJ_08860 [Streptomyces sp. NPDC086091]|uniref:hypothetical protein n=1 Tax=Streptomyces sp. NPDC086091 TaxID=3365751 RepID=UPI0037F2DAA9